MIDFYPTRKCPHCVFNGFNKKLTDIFDNENWPFTKDTHSFRTDIKENEDLYIIEAELPGFTKEEITVELIDDTLIIQAVREDKKDEKDEKNRVLCQERRFGKWVRRFYIENIQEDKIQAKLANGILTLEIPKTKPNKPVTKQIPIK